MPPKVEYSLTTLGRSLELIVVLMTEWGGRYVAQRDAAVELGTASVAD